MAGIYINSRFKPLSYAEIVAPLAQQTEVQNQYEDAYAELDTKASVWEGMADKTRDKQAYQQYKKYADDLHAAADNLLKNGLNPSSRAAVANLRARYASEITPIEQAYRTRQEQMKMQQEAMMKDPTHLFAQQASNVSLDKYLNNQQYDALSQNYSGNLLTQQVGQQAAALAKELHDFGKTKSLDKYTGMWMQQHGFNREQVLDAIYNPNAATSQSVLNAIVESTINGSGIKGWKNNEALQQAYNYAKQGLWQAVGQTQVNPFENFGNRLAAQKRVQQELNNPPGIKGNDPGLHNVYSTSDIANINNKTQGLLDKAIKDKLVMKDSKGNYKITSKGWKALNEQNVTYQYDINGGVHKVKGQTYNNQSYIKDLAKAVGYYDKKHNKGAYVTDLNSGLNDWSRAASQGQLPKGMMNFQETSLPLTNAQSESLIRRTLASMGKDGVINQVTGYKDNGNGTASHKTHTLKREELEKLLFDDNSNIKSGIISDIRYSAVTGKPTFVLTTGERIEMPVDIISNSSRQMISDATQSLLRNEAGYNRIAQKIRNNTATPEEIATYSQREGQQYTNWNSIRNYLTNGLEEFKVNTPEMSSPTYINFNY